MSDFPSDQQLYLMQQHLNEVRQQHWYNHELLSWQWWLLLAIAIVPWLLFWKVIDKRRVHEILLYGFFVSMLSILLDNIGSHLQLWDYSINLTPLVHQLGPINLAVLPVSFMIIYQIFPKVFSFLIAHTVLAAGGAFVVEPFFHFIHIYRPFHWKGLYSFPIYILMALMLRTIMILLQRACVRN